MLPGVGLLLTENVISGKLGGVTPKSPTDMTHRVISSAVLIYTPKYMSQESERILKE
jgi:hypothetical protein